ncbi:MAG: DUF3362 domain-containing protein, partial [Burkholderiaceae bacterium]
KMMKPGMGAYDAFKEMFDRFSKEAGKEQYLIPYFIAAHPGTTDEDMLNLALWLKKNNFRLDQVQTFLPTPMAIATAMYHTRKNPLHKVTDESEIVETVRTGKIRRLHKAFLRYHDPENWEILREGLLRMGRSDLIGSSERHLVPRSSNQTAGLVAVERSRETPTPNKLAKKFGQNKPRPGGAVVRTTSNTQTRKPAGTPRTGRK